MKRSFTIRRGAPDGVETFLSVAQHRSFRRQRADEFQLTRLGFPAAAGGRWRSAIIFDLPQGKVCRARAYTKVELHLGVFGMHFLRKADMALVRVQDETLETEGIHFLMQDAITREKVPCIVAAEALTGRGATHDPPMKALQQVFDTYRDEIERAASDRWRRGEVNHRHIIRVTISQFPQRPPAAEK